MCKQTHIEIENRKNENVRNEERAEREKRERETRKKDALTAIQKQLTSRLSL